MIYIIIYTKMVYMYNKKFPKKDDLIYGEIVNVNDYGIQVKLLDYNDIIGCISINETSRLRKKQSKSIAVGIKAIYIVMAVDEVKGYIDLSKHNVDLEEHKLFDKKRKSHILLYNFFKYILMKLKGYENISFIQEDELNDFMVNTFWEIQTKFDDNEGIHAMIFDPLQNEQVLEEIKFSNVSFKLEEIKKIVDYYISTKLNQSKSSGRKEFKMLTYKITGVEDLKYATDFPSFPNFDVISRNYDVKICYDTNTVYTIYLEQKVFSDDDVNTHIEQIFNEIKQRAKEKQIMFY